MSKLIRELTREHEEITQILKEIQDTGISSAKGKDLLMTSKTRLLAHLEKEDRQLYPVLQQRAKTNPGLKRMLDTFGEEMDKITEFTGNFYQKYSDAEAMNNPDFSKDMISFITTIKNRIMREEVAIYKEYEKIYQE